MNNKKYVTIIGIVLAVCLVSSGYALLVDDNGIASATITNTVSKDISDENKIADGDVDEKIGVNSGKEISNSIVKAINIVPTSDKIYTLDGKTYIEAYDGNNNKIVGELGYAPSESFVDKNGNEVVMVSDPNEKQINPEDYNLQKEYTNPSKDPNNMIYG